MRVASVGHAVFAAIVIGLGMDGLVKGGFSPVWEPVPKGVPFREVLAYLLALVSLGSGVGLLWTRAVSAASRALLAILLLPLLLFRLPRIFLAPTSQDSWSGFGETSVCVAGAWVLYAWFASDWDQRTFGFATGKNGIRIASILYGVAVLIFGEAQFRYLKETASLVPDWLPYHAGWAFFTGCTFVLAGVGILIGVWSRLAAALSALQLGLFALLVWVPIVADGSKDAFQWSETVLSFAIAGGAWVVADSYRGTPWLAAHVRPI